MRLILCFLALSVCAFSQAVPIAASNAPKAAETYKGKVANKVVDRDGAGGLTLLGAPYNAPFHNGTVEVNVAGYPAPGSPEAARGFVGIAFRIQNSAKYELIYLRPTNGRADDQLRRNHSAQYEAEPDWPWDRLRSETPGVYESYVDLETGAWTKYRIVVKGTRAELYVNGAAQPCLIVKDLKLGDVSGPIAFWVGPGTEAWFADLKVSRAP